MTKEVSFQAFVSELPTEVVQAMSVCQYSLSGYCYTHGGFHRQDSDGNQLPEVVVHDD